MENLASVSIRVTLTGAGGSEKKNSRGKLQQFSVQAICVNFSLNITK